MTGGASYSKFKTNAAWPRPWGSRPCNDPQCGIAGFPWMVTIGSDPMLKSMTGYGRAEGATAPYLYTVEVQAFNHRFTDIRIRLPRALASLEHGLNREIRERVHRGRFDVQVTEKLSGEIPRNLRVDRGAIQQYVGALRELQRELDLLLFDVHLDAALLHGEVHAVVDVERLDGRVLDAGLVHVALVGDDHGCGHIAHGRSRQDLVVSDRAEDGHELLGRHAHLVQDRKGHACADHGVVVAVDDVADVVQVPGDHAQLDLPLRHAEVLHDVAGDAADDADVPVAVLRIAHRAQELVRPDYQLVDLWIGLHVFQHDRLGCLGALLFHGFLDSIGQGCTYGRTLPVSTRSNQKVSPYSPSKACMRGSP